ncbi:MAG: O-antigen ligase family protein, partial [Lachnospiraceae bacterium]|nr:O-antigen ligase family protein [Lachnospiraceae bacterium]
YILVLAGYAACICASSTVVYVGLIMLFLMGFFLELITKRRRFLSLLFLVLGLVVMMVLFDKVRGGAVSEEFFSVSNQIQESGSVFSDSVGTNRMGAWRRIVALLPEHWLFGCGIEQLGRTFLDKYGWIDGTYFDKAHNEYLHLWITEGIFAVVFYLIFLFSLFLPGIAQFVETCKKKIIVEYYVFDEITQIVFFAFFGYIAQAFFNISVVQVAPYFWMMCGLLYSRKREWK